MYTYVHTRTHKYIHTHTRTRTHTNTHTHTHIHTLNLVRFIVIGIKRLTLSVSHNDKIIAHFILKAFSIKGSNQILKTAITLFTQT